jgi:hypothetical protein
MKYTLFLLIIVLSCTKGSKYTVQIKTVQDVLNSIYKNDSYSIKESIAGDLNKIGIDNDNLNFYIASSHQLLHQYKIPDQSEYIIKEYPKNSPFLVDISVPIVDSLSNKKIATLQFAFAKFLPRNKLYYFQFVKETSSGIIEAPSDTNK